MGILAQQAARRNRLNLELAKDKVRLTHINDSTSFKNAQKLYHSISGGENMSRFPAFLQDLDKLIDEYKESAEGDTSSKSPETEDTELEVKPQSTEAAAAIDEFMARRNRAAR